MRDSFRGCLLGGAVGDALGAPVEFMGRTEILGRFGEGGITEYAPAYGRLGAITDDTQMTLFTAEGLLRAWVRGNTRGICSPPGVIAFAYQRWLSTQGVRHGMQRMVDDGWLLTHPGLHAQRAPGHTCLAALQAMKDSATPASNDSKGCGGVMRVAPVGLFHARTAVMISAGWSPGDAYDAAEAFDLACQAAAITHGHPTGQLAAGAFASIVMALALGTYLPSAVAEAMVILKGRSGHEETSAALQRAVVLAAQRPNDPTALASLGQGWVAEEALAIAVYCALGARDFRSAVQLAVNHDGDSDSTGSMVGQLLGAAGGTRGIPSSWLDALELKDLIETVADDLVEFADFAMATDADRDVMSAPPGYFAKYPGG
ncbi:ADP-ribosylglycohydrolase family protein [Xylophilus sp. Kf1]|nr:ADP-ribosylglycohydrolase family protein [Xylophilus sp. Kf1]